MFKNLFNNPRYLIENLQEGSTHYAQTLSDAINKVSFFMRIGYTHLRLTDMENGTYTEYDLRPKSLAPKRSGYRGDLREVK